MWDAFRGAVMETMLVDYKRWADETFNACLADVDPAELVAPRSILFGSILRVVNHIYAMDDVWKAHLEGRRHGYATRNPDVCPPFAELREMQASIDAWFITHVASLDAEALGETIEFEFIGGGNGAMTRSEMIQHVVTHGTYHRGHIGTSLNEIPVKSPTTDLPVYLREQRAGA